MVECAYCGELFQPAKRHIITCSPRCSQKSANRKTAHKARVKNGLSVFSVFHRDSFRCVYCGGSSFGNGRTLHADHILPKAAGGEDTLSNLVTACDLCNHAKNSTRLQNEAEILAEVESRNLRLGLDPSIKINL